MAVSLNNAGASSGDGFNTSLTVSVTVSAGDDRYMVAFTNAAVTGVTYGGVSMTLLNTQSDAGFGPAGTKSWGLAAPTVGTANLVATRASDGILLLSGATFNGVDSGASATFHTGSNAFYSSPTSISTTVPSGGMAVAWLTDNNLPTTSVTGDGGTTKASEFTAASYYQYSLGYEADATNVGWSWSSGQKSGYQHVVVLSATGGGSSIAAISNYYSMMRAA